MDLVTRLLLNTNQFDNNIRNSTQQVRGFQQRAEQAGNGIRSIMSVAGKAVAGVGLALSAKEGFDKFISASQTTGDAFNREIAV